MQQFLAINSGLLTERRSQSRKRDGGLVINTVFVHKPPEIGKNLTFS